MHGRHRAGETARTLGGRRRSLILGGVDPEIEKS